MTTDDKAAKKKTRATTDDIVANAERLLLDAEFLLRFKSHASAFLLAVLAFEEVGKALLWQWHSTDYIPPSGTTFHLAKQQAAASLLLAEVAHSFIKKGIDSAGLSLSALRAADTPATQRFVEDLARAMHDSKEGRLTQLVNLGAVDLTKQATAYVDHWFLEHDIIAADFSETDPRNFIDRTRRLLRLMIDKDVMTVGQALFNNQPTPLKPPIKGGRRR